MNTIEKILYLIKVNNTNEYSLEKTIGLASGAIKNWRNGKSNPSVEAIKKIAVYFNVSADWLLGLTDDKAEQLKIPKSPNQVTMFARGGEKVQYTFTDAEIEAIKILLDGIKKDK